MNTDISFSAGLFPAHSTEFFRVFVRLEYTLKSMGYAGSDRVGGVVPDWDKFANEQLGRKFFEHVVSSSRANTWIGDPPKRQILDDRGKLEFSEAVAVTNVQELFGAVRRVRNNLFHGGKSGDPDQSRNNVLILESIYVLGEILKFVAPEFKMRFEGRY